MNADLIADCLIDSDVFASVLDDAFRSRWFGGDDHTRPFADAAVAASAVLGTTIEGPTLADLFNADYDGGQFVDTWRTIAETLTSTT